MKMKAFEKLDEEVERLRLSAYTIPSGWFLLQDDLPMRMSLEGRDIEWKIARWYTRINAPMPLVMKSSNELE